MITASLPVHADGGNTGDANLDGLVVLRDRFLQQGGIGAARELGFREPDFTPQRRQRIGVRDVTVLGEVRVQQPLVQVLEGLLAEPGSRFGDEVRRHAVRGRPVVALPDPEGAAVRSAAGRNHDCV